MSGIVLWAEAKLGGLIKPIPPARGKGGGRYSKIQLAFTSESKLKTELQKTGISVRDRSWAKTLDDNRNAIQEVIDEETDKGNIPTREKVLRRIREKKAERGREALKRKAKTYSKMKKY